MAKQKYTDKHDVMISYNWDDKDTVLKIRRRLKKHGVTCWIDVERMKGSINAAMSEAVENCTVFLMCYSKKYMESKNCRKEAEYAEQKDKIIIPCKMERNFNGSGWLGILIGSKVFYEFSEKYPFEKKMKELLKEIKWSLSVLDQDEEDGDWNEENDENIPEEDEEEIRSDEEDKEEGKRSDEEEEGRSYDDEEIRRSDEEEEERRSDDGEEGRSYDDEEIRRSDEEDGAEIGSDKEEEVKKSEEDGKWSDEEEEEEEY